MAVTRTGRSTWVDGGIASQVLSAALAWLAAHTEWFGPRWDDHFPPRDFDGATVMELLMLCRLLRRSGPTEPGMAELERAAVELAKDMVAVPPGSGRSMEHLSYRLWTLALLADLGHVPDESFTAVRAMAERFPPRPWNCSTSSTWPDFPPERTFPVSPRSTTLA